MHYCMLFICTHNKELSTNNINRKVMKLKYFPKVRLLEFIIFNLRKVATVVYNHIK